LIASELPQTAEARAKAAKGAIGQITKAYGAGAILRLGDRVGVKMPHIPTGIPKLDNEVLGIGGFPRGRIVECLGPESSGKTTIALNVIAVAQKEGALAAFIDAENAFDPTWATLNGVNVDDLLVSQPSCGEEALEIADCLVSSGGFGIVVIDSVAALVPRAELEGEMGDSHVGLQARLMSQAMRKLTGVTNRTGTCLVFINQIREKVGITYGSNETTAGGRALKFYSSVRLDVRRIGAVKDGDAVIGNKVKIKAAKNKCAAPFRTCEVDLLFDCGFDTVGEVIDAAVEKGVLQKSGSWFSMGDTRLGQGKNQVRTLLREDKELLERIKKQIGN
jgi:recombination protein RecA